MIFMGPFRLAITWTMVCRQ